jgi:putative ABC transport system substrate-binding protein
MPVVGYLFPGLPEPEFVERAFRKGLSEHGFIEGRNVIIEARFARNEQSRLPQLAADLVRRRVNVIASTGGPAAAACGQDSHHHHSDRL